MNWGERGAFILRPACALVLLWLMTYRGHTWPLVVLVVVLIATLSRGIVLEWRAREAAAKPCKTPCACGCGLTWREATVDGVCGSQCRCGCERSCVIHKHHRGHCGS